MTKRSKNQRKSIKFKHFYLNVINNLNLPGSEHYIYRWKRFSSCFPPDEWNRLGIQFDSRFKRYFSWNQKNLQVSSDQKSSTWRKWNILCFESRDGYKFCLIFLLTDFCSLILLIRFLLISDKNQMFRFLFGKICLNLYINLLEQKNENISTYWNKPAVWFLCQR